MTYLGANKINKYINYNIHNSNKLFNNINEDQSNNKEYVVNTYPLKMNLPYYEVLEQYKLKNNFLFEIDDNQNTDTNPCTENDIIYSINTR